MQNFLASIALVAIASPAYAGDVIEYATVTSVKPRWENVSVNIPVTKCKDVEVPIYSMQQLHSDGATGGDVLTGMIIGGLLGKGITGKDNGAAAGAVFGGMVAADKKRNNTHSQRVITGYQLDRQCSRVSRWETQERLKNYLITYNWNGTYGQNYTLNHYQVGDKIPITVTLQANQYDYA